MDFFIASVFWNPAPFIPPLEGTLCFYGNVFSSHLEHRFFHYLVWTDTGFSSEATAEKNCDRFKNTDDERKNVPSNLSQEIDPR
jgi:hypothetical protein